MIVNHHYILQNTALGCLALADLGIVLVVAEVFLEKHTLMGAVTAYYL